MRTAPRETTTGLSMGRLGERLRRHRAEHRLSLAVLAARAGVSRSMLSAVERGAKAPTVLVLDRIATGLGTSIARLLGEERSARVVVLRRQEQDVGRDASGWERRILSPVLRGVEFEFMRTTIPPGVDAGEFTPHAAGSREYLAMERGALRLVLDGVPYLLRAGDSVYYAGDCTHAFANLGDTACVYYLVMDLAGERPRSHAPAPADEPARAPTPSPTGWKDARGGGAPAASGARLRGSR
jgi:XRE family transcriptional regulator, regulator of sulfur utilization